MEVKILSPAKVNLGLWILGKRPDGYHEILTVYHTVNLLDEIVIREGPFGVWTSTGIPPEENLVYRGIVEFGRVIGGVPDVSVFIRKRIPAGAGLGGGSSNLALTLLRLNELLGKPLKREELAELVGSLSSDAPFFLRGGTALGRGRGEILTEIDPLRLKITLILPRTSASTAEVYRRVREEHITPEVDPESVVAALREGRFEILRNTLGELACEVYPEIGEVVRFLRSLGFKPLVSGSGSGVFYIGEPSAQVRLGARLRGWRVLELASWLGV